MLPTKTKEVFEAKKLPTVLTAEELLDKAFGRASKVGGRTPRERALNKLATVSNILRDYFNKIIKAHPSYDNLPDFYREMIDLIVGVRRIKKALAALNWANDMTQKIINKAVREIKGGKNPVQVLKSAYGRISSIIEQIDEELRFLNELKRTLKEIPSLTDEPTVVVAGYPNVGKSSFVARVSSVKPEIASYPFTTKQIHVGYIDLGRTRIQIIDTPGLLDRPLEKRNEIEKKAILCLKHIANCILFIIDPTIDLEPQMKLLEDIKENFDIPVIVAYSKADLHDKRDIPAFSSVTGEGIDEIIKRIREVLKV